MDKLYSHNHLSDVLNTILNDAFTSEQLTNELRQLAILDNYDKKELNAYLLSIYALLYNTCKLSPLDRVLLEEIKNQVLFTLVEKQDDKKCCEPDKDTCCPPPAPQKAPAKDIPELSIYRGIPAQQIPDLDDNEAVKAYFLMKNKFLANPEGAFTYPNEGETAIITSGDNMTIPGVRFMINYVIDHLGNVVDIKGYPERVLERTDYEDIYKGLVGKLFDK